MNRHILKVKAKNPSLECTFDDGSVVLYDMKWSLKEKGPMIAPLKKEAFFRKAFLESGAVSWPNGYDICPNLIFQEGVLLSKPSHRPRKSAH